MDMKETTLLEEKIANLEVRIAKLEGTVVSNVRDLPSSVNRVEIILTRLQENVDRLPWFVLGSWVTIMTALLGGLFLLR